MTLRRLSDILCALVLLFVCLPVLSLAMVAVWLERSGSPIARFERVTREGRIVKVYILRTTEAGAYRPQLTELGSILRRFHIDQVPQLINVLKGDLSLMGEQSALAGEMESKDLLAVREP